MDEEKTIEKTTEESAAAAEVIPEDAPEAVEPQAEEEVVPEDAPEPVEPQAEDESGTEETSEEDPGESADAGSPAEAKPEKKAKKKKLLPNLPKYLPRKTAAIIVLIELVMLVVCIPVFLRSVSLNRNDDMVYTDPAQVDHITCSDGRLFVNDVSADVSTEGNVSYNISYTWGSEDTDFPSVPRAVTASYRSDEDEPLYDISLYRDSFTPNSKIADGKTVDNWFDDWEVTEDDDSTHQPLQEGDLHGFRITSNEDSKKANSGSIYTTSSFYFAVQEEDGVSVYVLEGILYDPGSLEECDKALSGSIRSITIKKQA